MFQSIILPNLVLLVLAGGLYAAYLAFFLRHIERSDVRVFPKWAWGVIVALGYPLGGVVYLAAGAKPAR
jgi:hypothetical protein